MLKWARRRRSSGSGSRSSCGGRRESPGAATGGRRGGASAWQVHAPGMYTSDSTRSNWLCCSCRSRSSWSASCPLVRVSTAGRRRREGVQGQQRWAFQGPQCDEPTCHQRRTADRIPQWDAAHMQRRAGVHQRRRRTHLHSCSAAAWPTQPSGTWGHHPQQEPAQRSSKVEVGIQG